MNRCFSLAVDRTQPERPHTEVRVYGHGALLGTLTLRNEEVECLKEVFYDHDAVVYKLCSGEVAEGGAKLDDERRNHRWSVAACPDELVVTIGPKWECPVKCVKKSRST